MQSGTGGMQMEQQGYGWRSMGAAIIHSENSRNGKQIAARESFRTSFSFTAILSYRKNKSLPCKSCFPKKSAATGRNIMPDNAACLDAGEAHHTFIPENPSKPTMKKQADRSKINTSKTPDNGGRSSKNGEIETYLSQHYAFRYNTVWGRAEYRGREDTRFVKVGRYEINTLRRELDNEAGLTTSPDNLYSIIESSFSPRVNPVQAYFKALPAAVLDVPNTHAIRELADCVVVRNPEKWLLYLTKWLMAVVANAMDDHACHNHTYLVLTGEQGRFKTTFLDLLCPPKLHGYSYTGKIYPQEKDTLTYVGQNLIINIDDQLKALNKRDENELKNLITCPMVKYRMPYGMGEALKKGRIHQGQPTAERR